MKTRLSHEEWQKHIEAQEKSGLTQRAYCELEGLSVSNFRLQRAKGKRVSKNSGMRFLEIEMAEQAPMIGIQVEKDMRISIRFNFNYEWVLGGGV